MSELDTATVLATYATVATYRQSPDPARVKAFNAWLDQVRAAARREGQAEAWREGRNAGVDDMIAADLGVNRRNIPNPYEAEEDRHVDQ